jgi:hypothetical protein
MTGNNYEDGLRFAAQVHDFIDRLRDTGNDPGNPHRYPAEHALATLLNWLIREPGEARLIAIKAAMDEYDRLAKDRAAEDESCAEHRAEQDQWYAEHRAEIARQHELAVTVECPYCGSKPGKTCRSSGPDSIGQSKGIYDHKARYRAAKGLTGEVTR